ncbi:epoxyqueuosine reductase [Methanobacterium petrolearium]|uniref:epoxyqueuosine reductase n=1 Tax=Methanobacterium petrolearium TaxID=710190 RepID=UPI001AEB7C6B|nr:epoxyqueuosine reductase [Methanobacterium petrolearium]MBP1946567.1 epoxyqueuosine reductase QueG [Methanobacterium petrolearium]BDZ69914.1 (Fe-S)-binding protein [Methanobacterium petrolearium]
MNAKTIKNITLELGADLCGIASVERFQDAPVGFNPLDIYSNCKSAIVFAKRVPTGSLSAESCVPYTHVNNIVTMEVDRIGVELCLILEDSGVEAVSIPSDDPSEYWEAEYQYARGILSLRHAGYLAGLGVMGKNTLLVNEKYGNMIQIGAVLVDIELKNDPIVDFTVCKENCRLCIDKCPQKALDGETVNQKNCRILSNFITERGFVLKKCNLCRIVCPNVLGSTK